MEDVPDHDYMLPLSQAEVCLSSFYRCALVSILMIYAMVYSQVIREGSDITIVGWGAQLSVLQQACDDAAKVSVPYGNSFSCLFYGIDYSERTKILHNFRM